MQFLQRENTTWVEMKRFQNEEGACDDCTRGGRRAYCRRCEEWAGIGHFGAMICRRYMADEAGPLLTRLLRSWDEAAGYVARRT